MNTSLTRRDLGRAALGACFAPLAGMAQPAPVSSAGVGAWRGHFPILTDNDAPPDIYLDSAATTQRPRAVLRAMDEFYECENANPGAALHRLARAAHTRYEAARATLARFINARDANEIVWTRGTTESINLVATAWAERELRSGDEILLTRCEHSSNLLPWRFAARRAGAIVRIAEVDVAGRIDLGDLQRKLNSRTRFVAFSHISNVVGYVNPAAEICALARAAGALTLIDAAQSAPHLVLDVQALKCDFLAFSAHKMLGPMGTGVLWGRRELLDRMTPYQAGSNMAHDVNFDSEVLEPGAHRFGAGTPNVAGAVGLAAAVEFLEALGRSAVVRHEAALVEYALARLGRVPGLRMLGPMQPENRIPVFTFVLERLETGEVLRHLDARGLAVRAGDLSALPLLGHFGTRHAVRASAYLYTIESDFDRLVEALESLPRRRRPA